MKISSRFILDNLWVMTGAFLAIAAMTWTAGVAGWVALGVSAAIAVIAGTSVTLTDRASVKIGHGLVGLAALWSMIAAFVFSGSALTWLVLADAIMVGVFALADLTVHEVTTEKVVHELVVPSGAHEGAGTERRIAA